MSDKLLAHFLAMQARATAYLVPEPYVSHDGKIAEVYTDAAGLMLHSASRDMLFAHDMIYMLDGPEQREAQQEAEYPIGEPYVAPDTSVAAPSPEGQQGARKQSSARLSTIAATYLTHADPNVRSLAASVLAQDETKGQAAPVRPGLTTAEPIFPDDPHMHRQDVAQPLDVAPPQTIAEAIAAGALVAFELPLQTIAEASVTPLDRQAEALADATEAEAVALAKVEEVVAHPALARRQSTREPVVVEPRPAPGELRNGHENLRGPGFEE